MSGLPTQSNGLIDYLNPEKSRFSIIDIAMGVGKACRFSGQCHGFYSVGQHSILVSEFVPKQFALDGLMHDGSEAFMQDLPTMLKALLPDYKRIEMRLQAAINAQFGLAHPDHPVIHPIVKKSDDLALMLEMRAFTDRPVDPKALHKLWDATERAAGFAFNTDLLKLSLADQMDYKEAEVAFLDRFDELVQDRLECRESERVAA